MAGAYNVDENDDYDVEGNLEEKLEPDIVHDSQFSGALYIPETPIFVRIIGAYESKRFEDGDSIEGSEELFRTTNDRKLLVSEKSLYTIRIKHGKFEWDLKKTYEDFESLNNIVAHQLRIRNLLLLGRGKRLKFPVFKSKNDMFRRNLTERKIILEQYLQAVVDSDVFRGIDAVINFLEISPVSFTERLGLIKWKEDIIRKLPTHTLLPLCCTMKLCPRSRWLVLKDTYLLYIRRKVATNRRYTDEQPSLETGQSHDNSRLFGRMKRQWRLCKVILMDQSFTFVQKLNKRIHVLKIYNTHGRLVVLCSNEHQQLEWNEVLTSAMSKSVAQDYVERNRFGSFAPPRSDTKITVFIDGACYMEAVARAIAQARHEIFITDWCMNPEVFLRRPVSTNTWRLDKLLQAKAMQGVRICIMLYNGIEGIVPFSSYQTSEYLQSLHPNIHVYLSPIVIRLWSHHEKMVAVDQSIIFMGGVDLCFGRWDTVDHKLQDVHKISHNMPNEETRSQVSMDSVHKISTNRKESFDTDAPRRSMNFIYPSDMTRSKSIVDPRPSVWKLPKPFKRIHPVTFDRRDRFSETPGKSRQRRFTAAFLKIGDSLQNFLSKKANQQGLQTEEDSSDNEETSLPYLEARWGSHKRAYDNPVFEDEDGVPIEEMLIREFVVRWIQSRTSLVIRVQFQLRTRPKRIVY